jgi:phenol hydroxylase P3 protein
MSHQFMLALYQWNFGTAFHSWIPSDDDMEWLSKKYPTTFDKYYRPRWEHIKKMEAEGTPFNNFGLAKLCQTCQLPTVFTEPGDPSSLCHRETEYKGETYQFCSEHCCDIFKGEPEKYVQAWLPMPALFQEPLNGDLEAWMKWVSLENGSDNGDYKGSHDQTSFQKWREATTSN